MRCLFLALAKVVDYTHGCFIHIFRVFSFFWLNDETHFSICWVTKYLLGIHPLWKTKRAMKCNPLSLQQQLVEEWSTHPPAYQDSWFRRDVFTAWDKQSKRMWEVLVKENKPIHFMFGNCICWNLSNLTKIVILQLFSLVSSQMCSLKTTCQNRFKFPYDHCFHICNLYLMETGTQCFKEETSNGERAVAKCLQKLRWHPPCPLKSGRCCIMSCSLSSSWTLDYYLNNCRSARWKRGLRFG